ncbi:MAG: TenA family protein [Desulfurococcaceae archaeon]
MALGLTLELRREADDIWKMIFEHPFVIELYTGVLPIEKFIYYLIQDYNYLVTMAKCFSLISAKSEYEISRIALELAYLDAITEMSNYEKILEKIGLRLRDVLEIEPAPTNVAYMSFLLSTCALANPIEALISLLPCFWSYMEIAEKHRDKLANNRNDLYVQWAQVYLSKEYRDLVERLRKVIDDNSHRVDRKTARYLFITASRFEYMFWDMSYKMEKWIV